MFLENKEENVEEKPVKRRKFVGSSLVLRILLLLCILTYVSGFFSASFLEGYSLTVFSEPLANSVVLVLGVFFLSIAFYGVFAPILFFLLGIEQATGLQQSLLLGVKLFPLLLAAYAGILLGRFLKKDLEKPMQWRDTAKKIVLMVAVAVILALVLEHFTAEIAAVKLSFF